MIEVKNLCFSYGNKKIIKNINFSVQEGIVLSVLGANGSGKTTLLKSIVGILKSQGEILLDGTSIKDLSKKQKASLLAYVPQSSFLPFDFTVLEIVLMGRFHKSSFGLNYKKEDIKEALLSLKKVGIEGFENRVYKNLSGGEKQLVLIARALSQESKIIIMDEPVTGLDLGNQMRLLDLISTLASAGKIVIQTTHYPDHALRVSNKVLWLQKGEILAYGEPKEVITTERIHEIYGINSEVYKHENGLDYILPLKSKKEY